MKNMKTAIQKNLVFKRVGFYLLKKLIGKGGSSQVYEAIDVRNFKKIALKVLSKQILNQCPEIHKGIKNQLKAFDAIRNSPYIVQFICSFRTNNNYYFAYQLCEGGSLHQLICQRQRIPECEAIQYIRQILEGLKLLYQHNIAHRDIKPSNILIKNGRIKLCDFGLCSIQSHPQEIMNSIVGTLKYQSPQILQGKSYTSKCDIYSLGVLFYKMLYGKYPYNCSTLIQMLQTMQTTNITFPSQIQISEKTKQIMIKMLQKIQYNRIGWEQLFNHFLSTQQKSPQTTISGLDNQSYFFRSSQTSITAIKPHRSKKQWLDKIIEMHEQILNITNILLQAKQAIKHRQNLSRIFKFCVIRLQYQLTDLLQQMQNRQNLCEIREILQQSFNLLVQISPNTIKAQQFQIKAILLTMKQQINKNQEIYRSRLVVALVDILLNRFVLPLKVYNNLSQKQILRRLEEL